MTRRPIIGAGAVAVAIAVVIATALVLALSPARPPTTVDASRSPDGSASQGPTARPTVRPVPGHEVFGFVPYWEMDGGIAAHLAATDLSTLALFSVTHRRNGSINTSQTGFERITGDIGAQLIREAHVRGVDVQLVFTSFGTTKNERFFGSITAQDATIEALVALAADIGVDGINVDGERLSADLVPAFGTFIGRLRDALRVVIPKGRVSAATGAGRTGAAMAAAASIAGADRIFLMGYDYHYGKSQVGASAPISRRDGSRQDLVWSLDMYEALGVPLEKTILGLPLYGLRWRVEGPEIGSPRLGDGAIWVPADNPNFLGSPPLPPELDPIEVVEFYAVAPTVSPKPGDSRATAGWQAIYVDSPRTLAPKLALADERGLAGAGFWAIGYERGLPDYSELIARFRAGKLE
ncbi:MAG: glycoside hydrolase family 18 protein [Chloroflexi bacterium]|nr:glycoside hydrolase family 18 protein [Chloroflexota bacterium]